MTNIGRILLFLFLLFVAQTECQTLSEELHKTNVRKYLTTLNFVEEPSQEVVVFINYPVGLRNQHSYYEEIERQVSSLINKYRVLSAREFMINKNLQEDIVELIKSNYRNHGKDQLASIPIHFEVSTNHIGQYNYAFVATVVLVDSVLSFFSMYILRYHSLAFSSLNSFISLSVWLLSETYFENSVWLANDILKQSVSETTLNCIIFCCIILGRSVALYILTVSKYPNGFNGKRLSIIQSTVISAFIIVVALFFSRSI